MASLTDLDSRPDASVSFAKPPPAATKRSRNAAKTRRDILDAAGQRFARVGYSRVTLKQIADDVGVTPALVVRYFGSKRALFEEVANAHDVAVPQLVDGDSKAQLKSRAWAILAHYEDRNARASGVALVRSIDLDDGESLRQQLDRRIYQAWASEVAGPDAEIRLRLIAGLLMGVGLFSIGALTEPDRPPLDSAHADRLVHYFTEMLAVCVNL
jgi:AcrR family transcriptional regulator